MGDSELAIFQFVTLVSVGTIGLAFSFVLPKPKNVMRQASYTFARLFIVLLILSQGVLAARHVGFDEVVLYLHPILVLATSYCVLLTVYTRLGQGIVARVKKRIAIHLSITAVILFIAGYFGVGADFKTAVMVVNCAIPLILAAAHVRAGLDENQHGDRVLFRVLIAMTLTLLFAIPGYLVFQQPEPLHETLFGFIVTLSLLLVFILGFGINVVYSLVLKLRIQMNTDPLTSAKNRHFFYEIAPMVMSRLAREKQCLTLILCDIDHFKRINDKHGHDAGDKALAHFAYVLDKELRKEDMLIRMGGEEFLIMSPATDAKQALPIAERIRKTIALTSFTTQGSTLIITASFGVITLAPDGDLTAAIKKADEALYRAKNEGRNRVVIAE